MLTFTKLFEPTQLGTTITTIFTAQADPTTTVIKNMRIRLTNTSSSVLQATLYCVPSGSSASTANQFLCQSGVAVNGYVDIDVPSMAAGDSLQGLASGAGITVHEMAGMIYT